MKSIKKAWGFDKIPTLLPFFIRSLCLLLFVSISSTGLGAEPSLSAQPFCNAELLLRLKGLQGPHVKSADFISRKLQGLEDKDPWLSKNLKPEVVDTLEQRTALIDFMSAPKLAPGERVVWLQQGGLKELNEKLWNIGGTEHFLQIMDEELSHILKNGGAQFGKRLHTNYKDRVFVTTLTDEELSEKVLKPLYEKVSRRLSQEFSGNDTLSSQEWKKWLIFNSRKGEGSTLLEAHLSKLGISGTQSYKNYIAQAQTQSQVIDTYLRRAGNNTHLKEVFKKIKESSGDKKKMREWLISKGFEPHSTDRFIQEVEKYRSQLAIADFLPLPPHSPALRDPIQKELATIRNSSQTSELLKNSQAQMSVLHSWKAQQAQFLSNSVDAGHIIAADVKGVGIEGLMVRDQWLRSGADASKIMNIYEGTSQMLKNKVDEVTLGLQKICGPQVSVHVYQSGDDLLISLPKLGQQSTSSTITAAQLKEIQSYLKTVPNLYSEIKAIPKPGEISSISETISKARDSMFDEKVVP